MCLFSLYQFKCLSVWELKRIDLLYLTSEISDNITEMKKTLKRNFKPNLLSFIALKVQLKSK